MTEDVVKRLRHTAKKIRRAMLQMANADDLETAADVIERGSALRMPGPMTDGELNNVSIRLRDDLLDYIYEYSTTAEGVLNKALTLCRAIEAETLRRVKEANNGQ